MSQLLEIQRRLLQTSQSVALLEREVLRSPASRALQMNLSSVEKRLSVLQQDFNRIADRNALDVCSYRLFKAESEDAPTLRGFSGALHEFQAAFSSLFDALKNGRRLRTRLTPDVLSATTFGFGYTFSGSVGVVLTIEKERLLVAGSLLDDTIATFFSLAKAPNRRDIAEIGKVLGPAPLRAIHKWAKAHAEDGIGADITWKQGEDVIGTLFLQHQQMSHLQAEIEAVSA